MRQAMVLAALAGCATASADPIADAKSVYVTIGTDAIGYGAGVDCDGCLAMGFIGDRPDDILVGIRETRLDVSLIDVAERDLDKLSHYMHEKHGRCGGFMVHESEEDARAAMDAVDGGDRIDYTIDRGEAVRAVLPGLDQARILETITQLSAMQNRYYRSEHGARASMWLADKWRSFTDRRDVTVELFDQGYPQKSVILTIPGTTRASEVVVIGGHLDSIARGGNNAIAPGADDDASGVATLTEVVRVLLASDYRPARTVKFMAYAAEEVGLRGSQAIARDYKKRGVDVVGALQLDMTNYQGSDRDIWLITDYTSATQNLFLASLIETYTGATWGLDACGYACSDHASWHRQGVPASMPFESRFRDSNRSIHTDRDTLERSDQNTAHAIKFARLAAAYAIELGKGQLGSSELAAAPEGGCDGSWRFALLGALALAGLWLERRWVR